MAPEQLANSSLPVEPKKEFSRRDFLKAAAVTGAAAIVPAGVRDALGASARVTDDQESKEEKEGKYLRFPELEKMFKEMKVDVLEFDRKHETTIKVGEKEYKVQLMADDDGGKVIAKLIEDEKTKEKRVFFGAKMGSGHFQFKFLKPGESPKVTGCTFHKVKGEPCTFVIYGWDAQGNIDDGDGKNVKSVGFTAENGKFPVNADKHFINAGENGDDQDIDGEEYKQAIGTAGFFMGRDKDGQDGNTLIGDFVFKKTKKE